MKLTPTASWANPHCVTKRIGYTDQSEHTNRPTKARGLDSLAGYRQEESSRLSLVAVTA